MVSSMSRILAALYLIIISVVLLAEITLFYVTALLPTALFQIIIFALTQAVTQAITPVITFLYMALDFFYATFILLGLTLVVMSSPTYLGFFLFIAGYTVSLALFPEAHLKDRLWLSLALSTSLLVIMPLFTRIFELVFPNFILLNTFLAILLIAVCCGVVYVKRKTVKVVRKEFLGLLFAFLYRFHLIDSSS